MDYKDERFFFGGLDTDTENRLLKPEDYRFAFCMDDAEGDDRGGLPVRKGNTLIPYTLPVGINKVVGSCPDIENNAIIYFLYNESPLTDPPFNHRILRYYTETDVVELIVASSYLNFQFNIPIVNPEVILGVLYWTYRYFDSFEDFNPPRSLDIAKAIAVGTSAGYSAITPQVLDFIKYPHLFAPTVEFVSDGTRNWNNLRGKLFQFNVRYVYEDFAKSAWSPTSKVALPQGDEFMNGAYNEDQTINNGINIEFSAGSPEVIRVEVGVREGNIGDFLLVAQLEKYDEDGNYMFKTATTGNYTFLNNVVRTGLDQGVVNRLFDYVPQEAGSQRSVEDNRIVYGDITENYDNVEIDVDLTAITGRIDYSDLTDVIPISPHPINVFLPLPIMEDGYKVTLPITPHVGALYQVHFIGNELCSYIMQPGDGVQYSATSTQTVYNGLKLAIEGAGYVVTTNSFVVTWPIAPAGPPFDPYSFYILKIGIAVTPVGMVFLSAAKFIGFKTGDYHEFCLIYYDRANRSGAANVGLTDSTEKYMPFYTESGLTPVTNDIWRGYFDWEINHLAPAWPTHYQWGLRKRPLNFFYFGVSSITRHANGYVDIDINAGIDTMRDRLPKSNIGNYVFTKGDRIRFIKNISGTAYQFIDTYLDFEIMGQSDAITTEISVQNFDFESYGITNGTIIEIRTPDKDLVEDIFVEIGEEFEITTLATGEKVHAGLSQNQTLTQPAKGTFANRAGDIYVMMRWNGAERYSVESTWWSDFYDSDVHNYGRPNIAIRDARRERLEILRHGGQTINNSHINEVAMFEFDDFTPFESEYGRITGLEKVSYSLFVFQEAAMTPMYISRESQTSAAGKEYLVSTDNIFGSKMPTEYKWGCKHPESIIKKDRYLYWWDINNGAVVRHAANGTIPVSRYKMVSAFRDIQDKMLFNDGNLPGNPSRAVASYNNDTGEYIIVFKWMEPSSGISAYESETVTLTFKEEINRWRTYLPFKRITDGILKEVDDINFINNTFVSFIDGELWKHNSNALRANFYGTQYKPQVKIVSNIDFERVKVFKWLAINSNNKWSAPEITIDPNANYIRGMFSRLKEGKFETVEGVWYAPFMKNMLTTSTTVSQADLIDGEELRGQYVDVLLECESTGDTVLLSVIVGSIPSQLSGK